MKEKPLHSENRKINLLLSQPPGLLEVPRRTSGVCVRGKGHRSVTTQGRERSGQHPHAVTVSQHGHEPHFQRYFTQISLEADGPPHPPSCSNYAQWIGLLRL